MSSESYRDQLKEIFPWLVTIPKDQAHIAVNLLARKRGSFAMTIAEDPMYTNIYLSHAAYQYIKDLQ